MTEFLGRVRYERRAAVDARGYRNGYGKPRMLTTPMGTIEVRRPRVRGEGRFESRILPLFVRRTQEVSALLPELYLHGLAEGTLTWPCGVFWGRRRLFRPPPWRA